MLETIREYAGERLDGTTEAAHFGREHAGWFLALAESLNSEFDLQELRLTLERFDVEHENLREALQRLHEASRFAEELALATAVSKFRRIRGHVGEGRRSLERALANAPPGSALPRIRARALIRSGEFLMLQGDLDAAEDALRESLQLAEEDGDERDVAHAIGDLGQVAIVRGDVAQATRLQQRALALATRLGDRQRVADALSNLTYAAVIGGDLARARQFAAQALEVQRALGDSEGQAVSLLNLGLVYFVQRDTTRAGKSFGASLEISRELGYPSGQLYGMLGAAAVSARLGRLEEASRLLGAADALAMATAISLDPAELAVRDETEFALVDGLTREAFDDLHDLGTAMPVDDAVEYALRSLG